MDSFYNGAIELEVVDPEEQYEIWKNESRTIKDLCFIDFPFLMDIGYKNELLKIECLEDQEKEK